MVEEEQKSRAPENEDERDYDRADQRWPFPVQIFLLSEFVVVFDHKRNYNTSEGRAQSEMIGWHPSFLQGKQFGPVFFSAGSPSTPSGQAALPRSQA